MLYKTHPPYFIVLASSVKTLEVKAIEFQRINHANRTMICNYDNVQTLMQISLKHSVHQILYNIIHLWGYSSYRANSTPSTTYHDPQLW